MGLLTTPALAALALLAAGTMVGLAGPFGYLRAAIAVAMFFALSALGMRSVRRIVTNPPEPEITDVAEHGLKYVCSMCGLELKIEKASRDKAPSHCMEPMVLVREDGAPPLRPV